MIICSTKKSKETEKYPTVEDFTLVEKKNRVFFRVSPWCFLNVKCKVTTPRLLKPAGDRAAAKLAFPFLEMDFSGLQSISDDDGRSAFRA
jgi:hypothetical protein